MVKVALLPIVLVTGPIHIDEIQLVKKQTIGNTASAGGVVLVVSSYGTISKTITK